MTTNNENPATPVSASFGNVHIDMSVPKENLTLLEILADAALTQAEANKKLAKTLAVIASALAVPRNTAPLISVSGDTKVGVGQATDPQA